MSSKLVFSIIPFPEWRREIAPLWLMDGRHRTIPPIINGHGQMQYVGRELFKGIVLFPIAAEYEGERIAWTSVYNISSTALRVRGIYVLPEYRSNGIGRAMVEYALGLWPAPWRMCYMYARESNVERYKRWGFEGVPGCLVRSCDEARMPDEAGIILMRKQMNQEEAVHGSQWRGVA